MTEAISFTLVPAKVLELFKDRAELSLRELAQAIGRDMKTMNRHRLAGLLPVHIKGTGLERHHYVCTLHDVAEFYRRTGEAGQFSTSLIPPSTSLTFKSKAIAFTAKPQMNVTLRRRRKRSVLKLDGSSSKPSGQDA